MTNAVVDLATIASIGLVPDSPMDGVRGSRRGNERGNDGGAGGE